jgi:hypothetical protein
MPELIYLPIIKELHLSLEINEALNIKIPYYFGQHSAAKPLATNLSASGISLPCSGRLLSTTARGRVSDIVYTLSHAAAHGCRTFKYTLS